MGRLVAGLALALAMSPGALANGRAAFAVGNALYDHAAPPDNPGRDAALVGDTLEALGFAVERIENATRGDLVTAFSAFPDRHRDTEVTAMSFAGHGLQFERRKYLLGRDARLRTSFDIAAQAVDLDRMVGLMRDHSAAALVVVDACRDNLLADAF